MHHRESHALPAPALSRHASQRRLDRLPQELAFVEGRQQPCGRSPQDDRRGTARMIASVTNGRGEMPAFKRKLSRQDIAAAVAYVRTLKR